MTSASWGWKMFVCWSGFFSFWLSPTICNIQLYPSSLSMELFNLLLGHLAVALYPSHHSISSWVLCVAIQAKVLFACCFYVTFGQANLACNLCLKPHKFLHQLHLALEFCQGLSRHRAFHFRRTALLGLAVITLSVSPWCIDSFYTAGCCVWLVQPYPSVLSQPHLAEFTRLPKWPTLTTSFTPVSGIISPHLPASSVLSWAAILSFSGMLGYFGAVSVWVS